jgi:hypothetical protein
MTVSFRVNLVDAQVIMVANPAIPHSEADSESSGDSVSSSTASTGSSEANADWLNDCKADR